MKTGAFFPSTAKKVLRAQRIAFTNRLPVVYLVDSAGVFLPLQEDVFPDEDDFGRIFRNNAVLSAAGLSQITAIMGNCVAGGGYQPLVRHAAGHHGEKSASRRALRSAGCKLEHTDTGQSLAELLDSESAANVVRDQGATECAGLSPISVNAYLGASPITEALAVVGRLVLTGRLADTSLAVGPAWHEFGWSSTDWD